MCAKKPSEIDGLVLGVIPARGGSKGISGKNLRLLGGRPLLFYAVAAARASGAVDQLILTTDSEEIASAGRALGVEVPFLRPAALAQDDTPMLPVLRHAVSEMERRGHKADVIVLLQPTAPLRRPEHIRWALAILNETQCDSVVSVVEVPRHYSPHYVMRIEEGRLASFLPTGEAVMRRQDAPIAYSRDGTVYAVQRRVLMEQGTLYGEDCRPLVLDASESINLDSMEDWLAAENRIRMRD